MWTSSVVDIAEAGRQYQACLEAVRRNPDDESICAELEDARKVMVGAWLEQLHAR